ncbi:MAG: ribonuclease J [Christensenellaceae bacterium]|jgi:ribonuclease J|nr:ribonuclease J [Christensenellaceae bacterium]
MSKGVKVIFLGGVGEIGKNMYALEYENEIIVLDCGLGFPTDDMPGIDCVVQDLTYLVQNKDKVRGYIITHGHEDHIGGIAYALGQVPAAVYGSRMTLALIENKLREHPNVKAKAIVVKARSVVQIGNFSIEFVHVNHSIAGCFALSVTTPVGVIFFTGDFKIDYTPVDGQVTDLTRIGEIGRKGVALMMCECTNAERKGHSISETEAGEQLDKVFAANSDRRLFVGTFASNIHRVQQLLDLAIKYNRKLVFCGRSMINVTDTAIKIGEMRLDEKERGRIIDITHIGNYKDGELLIVLTGSQGEPRSALVRMASGDFPKVQIGANDTIVFASAPIPGNEDAVNQVINNLIKCGAEVVYESLAGVHASGHAYEDEFKLVISLLNPHYFVPIHGEYKHMKKNVALAARLGVNKRNIIIPDLGDVLELSMNNLKRVGCIPSGAVLIDGSSSGSADASVLRDRQTLAEEGICIVGIGYNLGTGEITSGPDVATRGLLYSDELLENMQEARLAVLECLKNANLNLAKDDIDEVRTQVRRDLQTFFQKTVKRRPMVITMLQGHK